MSISLPFIDGINCGYNKNIYFDAHIINSIFNQQQRGHQRLVTFNIDGVQWSSVWSCEKYKKLYYFDATECASVVITGTLLNVTDKKEITVVQDAFSKTFAGDDFILEYDIDYMYKLSISEMILKHTPKGDTSKINVEEYYTLTDKENSFENYHMHKRSVLYDVSIAARSLVIHNNWGVLHGISKGNILINIMKRKDNHSL